MGEMRRGRLVGDEGELEVVDNPVDHSIVGEEGDDLHLSAASEADHRVHLIHFPDHLGPALGRDRPELVLYHPEG